MVISRRFDLFDTVRAAAENIELNTTRLMRAGFRKVVSTTLDGEGLEKESLSYRWIASQAHKANFESPHFVQYIPSAGVIKFESSLPKVLYKENVSMLKSDDVSKVLDEVSDRLSGLCGDLPHAKDFNVRGRVDAVYQWDTRDGSKSFVSEYLRAFRVAQVSRHKSDNYASNEIDRDATLYWFNRQRRLRMYDKFRESGLDSAQGILRFEVQTHHAKSELEGVGYLGDVSLGSVLNWNSARRLISKYLDSVGGDLVITDEQKLLGTLLKIYSPTKAIRLLGYIHLSDTFSDRELSDLGINRSTVWRNVKAINGAGVSRSKVKGLGRDKLPALRLPENYNGQPGIVFGGE